MIYFLSWKSNHSHVIYYKEMGEAFSDLLREKPSSVMVYSYIGNFTWEALCSGEYVDNLELKILLRDPGLLEWKYPPLDSGRQAVQKDRIINAVINRLAGDEISSRLAHNRLNAPKDSWVRFYQHEPTFRFVIATYGANRKTCCLGFYPLQKRNVNENQKEVLDYSGRRRPVMRIDDNTDRDKALIKDLMNWFDHFWNNVALTNHSS